MREYRRVLFDGQPSAVTREGDRLHAKDGRSTAVDDAIHLGPAPIREGFGVHPTSSEEVTSTALGRDCEFRGIRAPRGPGTRHYESRLDE